MAIEETAVRTRCVVKVRTETDGQGKEIIGNCSLGTMAPNPDADKLQNVLEALIPCLKFGNAYRGMEVTTMYEITGF